jgi:DNA-3-methyladenine glycosylase II
VPAPPAGRGGAQPTGSVLTPEAIERLRTADPVMRALIDDIGADGLGDPRRGRSTDRYGALVRSIVGQQLSTTSARAIFGRLTDRYGGRTPTPVEVLEDDPDELRLAAGLSHAKVSFLRSLAEHIIDGSLELDRLDRLPDEEVKAELVAIKGLGPWTADLFLMFQLQRPDVFPVGDLGIRRAVMVRYGLDQMPTPAEAERISEPWRPYRTLASLFLWRSLRNTPL